MENKVKLSKKALSILIVVATIVIIATVSIIRGVTSIDFANEKSLLISLDIVTVILCGSFLGNILYIIPNMKEEEQKSHCKFMMILCMACGIVIILVAILCLILWYRFFGLWMEGYGDEVFKKFLPYGLCFLLLGGLQIVEFLYWKKEYKDRNKPAI